MSASNPSAPVTDDAFSIQVDTCACTLTAPATTPWAALRRAADAHGLSLDGVVDTFDDETVGALLSRSSLLPPLWPPHTARAACIAITAKTAAGQYRTVTAPRTASGPDLRTLLFEAAGQHGEIESVVLGAERRITAPSGADAPKSVQWWRAVDHACWDELQGIVNRYGNVVTLHGQGAQLVARVRASTRVGALAARELRAVGCQEARRVQRFIAPHVVAMVPWDSAQRSARQKADAVPLCAGPTHVALAVAAADVDAQAKAHRWATSLVGDGPGRVLSIGFTPTGTAETTNAPMVLGQVTS